MDGNAGNAWDLVEDSQNDGSQMSRSIDESEVRLQIHLTITCFRYIVKMLYQWYRCQKKKKLKWKREDKEASKDKKCIIVTNYHFLDPPP